jgi:uncharacterized protein
MAKIKNAPIRKFVKIAAIYVLLLILIFALIIILIPKKETYFDYNTNKINYPNSRAAPQFTIFKLNETDNYTIDKISFKGKPFLDQQATIYGLLFLPKSSGKVPGIVMLPGGGVKKENEPAATAYANMGYAVLVIDQRGIGETAGYYPGYEQDRAVFQEKQEPIQFLGVNDALRAIDVMRQINSVDKNKIIISGASMGGRYALIAAALDDKILGAVIISSSGFNVEETDARYDSYFLAIDPDRYVKDISPKKLVMLHSKTDDMIPLADAQYTFSVANEPKSFYTVDNCTHGYCDAMYPFIEKELKEMTGK